MDDSAESNYLTWAVLSFATAFLSFAIYAITGAWPSELEYWGTAVFVLLGVAMVGLSVFGTDWMGAESTRTRSGSD